jgi:anti-sigma regulatory factor (Ser/Thr protein kinase)
VSALVASLGWSSSGRCDDLLVAVSEIVANSIRHGAGRRELRVWAHSRTVTCDVGDDGPGFADALAGYRPPAQATTGGRGLWIAGQLCDALAVDRRDGRTVVRFAVTVGDDGPAGP